MTPKLIKQSISTLYNNISYTNTTTRQQHTDKCCHQCCTHSNPQYTVHSDYNQLTYNTDTNNQLRSYSPNQIMNNVYIEQRNTIAQAQLKYIQYQHHIRRLQQPAYDTTIQYIPRSQQLRVQ